MHVTMVGGHTDIIVGRCNGIVVEGRCGIVDGGHGGNVFGSHCPKRRNYQLWSMKEAG